VRLHKDELAARVSQITPAKPLERKEVEAALLAETKTLKQYKKELVDYVKLKRFKVRLSNADPLLQDTEKERKIEDKL
jgi:hypothetical protein